MPLNHLDCDQNHIADLTPLRGMPLRTLHCSHNAIQDLTPVQGMPLTSLRCEGNRIQDLTPLRGMALQELICTSNHISDIAPLTGTPLQHLNCAGNRITDLSPLRGMPLTVLECQQNAITDLSPVSELPLQRLACGYNPITSLRPLQGMAIEDLSIEGLPLTEEALQLLQALPLRHLGCDLADPIIALLQAYPTLQGVNYHTVAYVDAIGAVMCQALAAWAHPDRRDTVRPALQRYATPCGAVRYLVLPIRFSRRDAESFCRFYGGSLVCPSTAEQFTSLLTHLAPIIYSGSELCYHLGLVPDPSDANSAGFPVKHISGTSGCDRMASVSYKTASHASSRSHPLIPPTGGGTRTPTPAIM